MTNKLTNKSVLALLSMALCFFLTSSGRAQSETSIEELKRQVVVMERIELDPNTTTEVKKINHELLVTRKAQLELRVEQAAQSLRQYRSVVAAQLTAPELRKIDDNITALETELQSLRGPNRTVADTNAATTEVRESSVASAGGSAENLALTASLLAAATPCPANKDAFIKSIYLVTGVSSSLRVELAVPLSTTQDPPVTISTRPGFPIETARVILPADSFQIFALPSSATTALPTSAYGPAETRSGVGRGTLFIAVTGALPAGDTDVRISLPKLRFECSNVAGTDTTSVSSASMTGRILDPNALNEQTKKAYDDAVAAAKSPDRKAFSAGFSAAQGQGEKAQGASDLLINKTFSRESLQGTILDFFDQAALSFQVKKSTAEKADPRYVNIGLNLRKTFLVFLPARPTPFTDSDVSVARIEAVGNEIRQDRSKGFFRVLSVGGGMKLEGEAFDFKTVNFVADPNIELGSIAKRLGSKGYYNLSIIGGAELGRNLSKPTDGTTTSAALSEVNWIARLMGGGQFTLRYLPSDETGAHWGVEFNAAYVNRHLFQKEVFTEAAAAGATPKITRIGEGNRAWRQADLKIFLFGDEKARYGFKVTYMNGSLPPAFTPTRGFQYGFVVETTDDKTNGKPANQ